MKVQALMLAFCAAVAAGGAIVLAAELGDEERPVVAVPGGDAERGHELIDEHGCVACHRIPGIEGPDTYVGPPLEDLAERRYIAGDEPNNVGTMLRWLQDPQAVEPGTVMPDLGISEDEARDIAAYLYSH